LPLEYITASSANARIDAAAARLDLALTGDPVVLVGSSRAAADEFAFLAASRRGGLFDVVRVGFVELATKLSLPSLAREQRTPMGGLGTEALVTRAAFDASRENALTYFEPVARMPGFPRAAARTLHELQLAGIEPQRLRAIGSPGEDLATLLEHVTRESQTARAVPRATIFQTAARVLRSMPERYRNTAFVLLDVAITSSAEGDFIAALVDVARLVCATAPGGDEPTHRAYERIGGMASAVRAIDSPNSLQRLQRYLFSPEMPPAAAVDDSVQIFSAPGEGREAVEIARRVVHEAARGVPFDEMAVLLRAPQTYFGLIEHAFSRARIPVWFERGTRRPDPAGRAFLSLLACAEEQLSARRFAEYLSLGQVPVAATPRGDSWSAPTDDLVESIVPASERPEDPAPLDEAPAVEERDRDRVIAGTL
jgi:hypothetical protein